tara:strand:+ start:2044 stop:3147 length:1104 start_codon:yes stop_codon:yes gene_type:complete
METQQNIFFDTNVFDDFTSHSISFGDFKRQMDEESVVFPVFQRNYVWTTQLKQRYLETISKRGPIFGFVMNLNSTEGRYEMIDGQNRGKTIYDFMSDKISFNKDPDEGGAIFYSGITGSEKRKFDRQEIHFIKTLNWDDDDCQEYFRSIQEGMKLTKGEEIHSAQNNFFQNKVIDIAGLFEEPIKRGKKDGGFNYVNKRYLHYEIIGGLLKSFMENKYFDRPGKVALKELKTWDNYNVDSTEPSDVERRTCIDNAVSVFEAVMKFYIHLREGSENLNKMTYSRDSTFMRSMFFIFENNLYLEGTNNVPSPEVIKRFDTMMGIILKKGTPLFNKIKEWGGYGGIGNIMKEYKRVFDDPTSIFDPNVYL